MKKSMWIFGVLAAAVLAFAGCSKSNEGAAGGAASGPDYTSLAKSFTGATGDVQVGLDKIKTALRYSDYPTALSELEKLAANSSLTEPQKKAVGDMIQQIKTAVAGAASKAMPGAK
jgi:hypothetical protein